MDRSTVLLISLLVVFVLFSSEIQGITGQAIGSFWSRFRTPSIYTKCSDSDGGLNYNTVGTVTISYLTSQYGKETSRKTYTDSCKWARDIGNTGVIIEYYCSNNKLATMEYKCPSGCKDGACIQTTKVTCTDTDGNNYYTKGSVNLIGLKRTLLESVAGSTNVQVTSPTTATLTFGIGSDKETKDIISPACYNYNLAFVCVDEIHYFGNGDSKNNIILLIRSVKDICKDSNTAIDWICAPQLPEGYDDESFTCPNGCKDGACVERKISLKSDYFCSDNTALDIVNGKIIDYKFSDFSFANYANIYQIDSNKFQYKIFSALKMLGYSLKNYDNDYYTTWIEAFQKIHNLPLLDIITSDFIKKLDEEIYNHENQIKPYISLFPVDEGFDFKIHPTATYSEHVEYVPYHPNEPSKDHVRFYFSFLTNFLPDNIALLTKKNVFNFFKSQAGGLIYQKDSTWKMNYIPSADPLNKFSSQSTYTASKFRTPDSLVIVDLFHEYGHQIDLEATGPIDTNIVDTRDFYKILFNMSDCIDIGYIYCKKNPEARFVSKYSFIERDPVRFPGYSHISESFAESFVMYIINGRLYKKLTTLDLSYKLQYDWLKENVFNGVEYCSGDENLIVGLYWDYYNNKPPSHVSEIIQYGLIPQKVNEDQPILSLLDMVVKC